MRPLSWIVTAAAVAVLLLGTRAVRARRARPAVAAVAPEAEPAPPPRPRPPVFHPPPPALRARPVSGMAHLRGRVVPPAGMDLADVGTISVTADDGKHEYPAAVEDDGRFELHLPARSYTLTARTEDLAVTVADVRARPGVEEELTITLAPTVAIEGTVEVPPDFLRWADLAIYLSPAGSDRTLMEAQVKDRRFELRGLIRGAVYDVTVVAGPQRVVQRRVTAPATVELALAALATLRGQIGFAPGTRCPFRSISLGESDGEEDRTTRVDPNCRFEFDEVQPGSEVHLGASAEGWHVEGATVVPARGDPELLCLNPPCRALPPVPPAELEVILTGAPNEVTITASLRQEDGGGSCSTEGNHCQIQNLIPGLTSHLFVQARRCNPMKQTLTLESGKNTVTVACPRMRVVEGVARGNDGQRPTVVSCRNGGEAVLKDTSLFELSCPIEESELYYRAVGRPMRRAPLPPDVDPAFVELTL